MSKKAEPDQKKDDTQINKPSPPPIPDPVPPAKTVFNCEIKKDYEDYKCAGKVKVQSKEELDKYIKDYGLDNKSYKDIEIAFPLVGEDLQLHSPCSITIQEGLSVKMANLCLDGRSGIKDGSNGKKLQESQKLSFNVSGNAVFLSEKGDVKFNKAIELKADSLYIIANGSLSLGANTEISVIGESNFIIQDQTDLKNDLIFSTNVLNIDSVKKLSLGERASVNASKQINFDSYNCNIHKSAIINSSRKTGSCFGNINHPPVMIGDQQFLGKKIAPVAFTLNGATDEDGDVINYEIVDLPAYGTVSNCLGKTTDLTCIYTPGTGAAPAAVSFTYRARDSVSKSNTLSTVKIILNEAPTMGPDQALTTTEDSTLSFSLNSANDVDGDSLKYSIITSPLAGSLSGCLDNSSSLNCVYIPQKDYSGTVNFTYIATDGYVMASKVAKVTIVITPVNDAPIMIGNQVEQLHEDTVYKFKLKGATDPENNLIVYSIVNQPTSGVLSGCAEANSELECQYVPQKDFYGSVTFTYKAFDGALESSTNSTVTLNVDPVNDPPIVGDDNFIQAYADSRVTFEVSKAADIDSSNIKYEVVDAPKEGSLLNCFSTINKRTCEYLPNPGFEGSDYFTFRVTDGELYSNLAKVVISVDQRITPSKVIQLASGEYHTCALLNNGQVRCWGSNEYGQLGHENKTQVGSKSSPYSYIFQAGSVDLGGFATEIASGKNHTCALLDNGRVRCWGANQQGQAGYSIFSSLGDEIGEAPSLFGDVPLNGHVVHISAGYYSTCALLMNGEVHCWGSFGTGKNGYVSPLNSSNLEIDGTVVGIVSGFKHACALLDSGNVKCWSGDGSLSEGPLLGELGYNHKNDVGPNGAADVAIGGKVIQLSSKSNHTCALLENKKVRCWGANFMGQLGQAITAHVGDGVGPTILQMGNAKITEDVKHISTGVHHTCAVLTTGDVRCWGRGAEGQLGYGGDDEKIGDNENPSTISVVDLGAKAISTSLGLYTTCALLETGQVRCWGRGNDGRGSLGYGNDENIGTNIPPREAGDLSIIDPLAISVGAGFAKSTTELSLLQLNGSVSLIEKSDKPKIIWDKIFGPGSAVFQDANGLNTKVRFSNPGEYVIRLRALNEGRVSQDVVKVTVDKSFFNPLQASEGHTCFINISGSLECIGDNVLPGPIVGNATVVPDLPELVNFASRKSIHCAIDVKGFVYCWGASFATGRAVLSSEYTYEKKPVYGIDDATEVAVGNATACALLRAGTIKCWGLNDASSYGTLGDGLALDSSIPVNVFGISNAKKIVMGAHYGCALLIDSTVKCWGEAIVPDQFLSFFPQQINLNDVADISAGDFHACAVKKDGSLYCWGLLNNFGEQGNGSTKSTAPSYGIVKVVGVSDAISVAAGLDYTCYLKNDQTVKCFGNNQYGQLGNGTTTSSFIPVSSNGLQNVIRLTGGHQHACALSQDQSAFCWGKNEKRQIENSNNLKILKAIRVFNTGGNK